MTDITFGSRLALRISPWMRTVSIGVPAAIVVFLVLRVGGLHAAELSIGALVALLAILAAVRWPGLAIGAVIVAVPLQTAGLAYLYHHGVPGAVVKDLGYIKDAGTFGVCAAAVRAARGLPGPCSRLSISWSSLWSLGVRMQAS